jgi:two-component system OmpR family response regulator
VRPDVPASLLLTKPPTVLVVDDDPEVAALLSRYLSGQGMQVRVASDGSGFRTAMRQPEFDVVLLDLGLPDEDGLALMRELRTHWSGPIIIVSGRGESVERIVGLELGADDYVGKPFDLRELLARIRSVMRRWNHADLAGRESHTLRFDGMCLDPDARCLTGRDGRRIELTTGEFDLLVALLEHPQHVLTRDQLMNRTHRRDAGPFDRAIDMQIGRLRRKLEQDPANPVLIRSVRGVGYFFSGSIERG